MPLSFSYTLHIHHNLLSIQLFILLYYYVFASVRKLSSINLMFRSFPHIIRMIILKKIACVSLDLVHVCMWFLLHLIWIMSLNEFVHIKFTASRKHITILMGSWYFSLQDIRKYQSAIQWNSFQWFTVKSWCSSISFLSSYRFFYHSILMRLLQSLLGNKYRS